MDLPAEIVSPPLRIKIRPISLFIEKGSKGITVFRAPEPPKAACRIAISTSAEVPFVRTLIKAGKHLSLPHSDAARGTAKKKKKKEPETNLGLRLVTAPEARSNVALSLDIAAGTSRE